MKPAYTPGPWLARVPHCVRAAESGSGILEPCGPTSYEEDVANLQLAAAAPEMYELLMEIEELTSPDKDFVSRQIYKRIQAIIAKVEGK